MRFVSHLTLTSNFFIDKICIGDTSYDCFHELPLHSTEDDKYKAECYFYNENEHLYVKLHLKSNITNKENIHILRYNFNSYAPKYDLLIRHMYDDYDIVPNI